MYSALSHDWSRIPAALDLLVHPLRQAEIELVGAAVGVADDRGHLKAAREVEGRRGVVEDRIDVVTPTDVVSI